MRVLMNAFLFFCSAFLICSVNAHNGAAVHSFHRQALFHRDSVLSALREVKFHTQTYNDCLGALSAQTRTIDNVKGCLTVQGAADFSLHCAANINSPECAIDINAASKLYGGQPTGPPGSGSLPLSCAKAIAGGTDADSLQCARDLGLTALPPSCFARPPKLEQCITDVLQELSKVGQQTTTNAPNKVPPMWVPKSCIIAPPTPDSVSQCATEFGIVAPASCSSSSFNLASCVADMTGAMTGKITGSAGADLASTVVCLQSIQTFATNVNQKCAPIIGGLSNITSTSVVEVINAQCTIMTSAAYNECIAAVSNIQEITAVQNVCPTYHLGQILAGVNGVLQKVEGPISAMCGKDDDGAFCLSSVLTPLSNLATDFSVDKVTDNLLASVCKPCMINVIQKLAAFGGSVDSSVIGLQTAINYLHFVCMKDPTDDSKYCIKTFPAMKAMSDKTTTPTDTDFTPVCSPCIGALIQHLQISGSVAGASINALYALQKLCIKDGSGGQCGPYVFGQLGTLSTRMSACSSSCTDSCKASAQSVFSSSSSCCFASVGFQNILEVLPQSSINVAPQLSAASICSLDVSSACTIRTALLPIDLVLPNIDATAAAKTQIGTALVASLKKDFALLFGVDASAIVIGAFSKAANDVGTKVTLTITLDADFHSSYRTTFQKKTSNGGLLPLRYTANTATAMQAKVVDAQPVAATATANTAVASPAYNNNHASALVVALAICAAWFLYL